MTAADSPPLSLPKTCCTKSEYLCAFEEVFWGPGLLLWEFTQHGGAHLTQHRVDAELNDVVGSLHQQVEF